MSVPTKKTRSSSVVGMRVTLTGLVQGIGMRPAIARFAKQLLLNGYVYNSIVGVEVHVEGEKDSVDRFRNELYLQWPKQANVGSCDFLQAVVKGCESFVVGVPDQAVAVDRCGETSGDRSVDLGDVALSSSSVPHAQVPVDVVVCEDCLSEVNDSNDRRYRYPFTSCTNCGPRYSIIERMPFERIDTSMSQFSMCEDCQSEYESTNDRRFHAQTNACPECGPQVWLRDVDNNWVARDHDAILAAARVLQDGGIVALRGLGGYQLLVDGTSQVAVERLRKRKRRQGKPLAIMVASFAAAREYAVLDEAEAKLLCSPEGPIVIAQAKSGSVIATSVSQGLNTIGVMLPTTPLHWLLQNATEQRRDDINGANREADVGDVSRFRIQENSSPRPLVCTSANIDGEPIVYQSEIALEKLTGIADIWLEHDRPIIRPIDDSVMRVMAGQPMAIRLARGYVPLPLSMVNRDSIVALGGHQKCSQAISNDSQAMLGPHIGDLNSVETRLRFTEQVSGVKSLYGIVKCQVACDRHPDYFTSQWAEQCPETCSPAEAGSITKIQHHFAHIVSGMLEHGWLEREVLGVAFDGTGYGEDETVWGGEFLRATVTGFERVGHLRPFPLPGGELAIRQPWRIAVSLVAEALGDCGLKQLDFDQSKVSQIASVISNPNLFSLTTSAGRLFDGIAALILGIEKCEFEGQGAMLLESTCDSSVVEPYEITIENTNPKQLDWRKLVKQVMEDRIARVKPGTMAMRFHYGLALSIASLAKYYPTLPVVLGGGVFQNRILVELLAKQFKDNAATSNQELGLPGWIPVNDGGLAAGQLVIAAELAKQKRSSTCV